LRDVTDYYDWFMKRATGYAVARSDWAHPAQFAEDAWLKARNAWERRASKGITIEKPKKFLEGVIANAWRDETKSYARWAKRVGLPHDELEPGLVKVAVTFRGRTSVVVAPVASEVVVSHMSEDERQRRDDKKREHEESESERLCWIS
jgi:hypothetical protein